MQKLNPSIINMTRSEAWSNDLPPIGFSLDYSGTGLSLEKFPEDDVYLTLHRPPEGSLKVIVKSYRSEHHGKKTLLDEIRSVFSRNGNGQLIAQKTKQIDFAGIRRHAREFTTGKGLSRKRWTALLLPSPDGGPYGLMVLFGVYIGSSNSSSVAAITKHPQFKTIVESFSLKGSR
jgi:hypothetical protein